MAPPRRRCGARRLSVRLEAVAKRVAGQVHLNPLDLELEPGLNVLLGPTLAGKTSLLRILAGLDRPSEGRVIEDGKDVTGQDLRRRSVAMVYQQFINYPSLSVFENIASPLRLARRPRDEIDTKVKEVARLLHIDQFLGRLPAELSGGQQQRTAIGRALAKEAGLLLLDEPLVNLDYKLREELRVELAALFARRQAVVVYATTEPLEALLLGGRVVVMNEGRILQAGRTLDVYHRPASTAVAAIFSDPPMNLVDGELREGAVELGDAGRLPAGPQLERLASGRYRFGVRANHLGVMRGGEAQVELAATVALAEISGSETFIHATCAAVDLVVQAEGVHPLRLGAPVGVFVDPGQLYAFDAHDGALLAAPARSGGA